MSLIQRVTDLVNELGEVSGDDLLPYCEGYERDQVLQALQNAGYRRQIQRVSFGSRKGLGGKGSAPAIWGPLGKPVEDDEPLPTRQAPRGDFGIPRVSSVWQLGAIA